MIPTRARLRVLEISDEVYLGGGGAQCAPPPLLVRIGLMLKSVRKERDMLHPIAGRYPIAVTLPIAVTFSMIHMKMIVSELFSL